MTTALNKDTILQLGGTLAALMEDDTPLPAVVRALLYEFDEHEGGNILALLIEALVEPDREGLVERGGELFVTIH